MWWVFSGRVRETLLWTICFDPGNKIISSISRRVVVLEDGLDRAEMEGKRPGWGRGDCHKFSVTMKNLGVLWTSGLTPLLVFLQEGGLTLNCIFHTFIY